jgi:hypothetical protein
MDAKRLSEIVKLVRGLWNKKDNSEGVGDEEELLLSGEESQMTADVPGAEFRRRRAVGQRFGRRPTLHHGPTLYLGPTLPFWFKVACWIVGGIVGLGLSGSRFATSDVPADAIGKWVAYVDSIGKLDPQPWIAATQRGLDTLLAPNLEINTQLSAADWATYLESKKTGHMDLQTAARIFQDPMLLAPDASPDSARITVLAPAGAQKNGIELVQVNAIEMDWEADVYFLWEGCLLGKQHVFHKYGMEAASTGGDFPVAYHNSCEESGTGVWEHSWMLYTVTDKRLVPMGWIWKDVNQANPIVYVRQLEAKVMDTHPLTVQYDWKLDWGYRYKMDRPSHSGKTTVTYQWDATQRRLKPQFVTKNLNAEKLLAFGLGAPDELVVYAWRKELKADLLGKNKMRRLAAVEFLEAVGN